MDDPAPPAVSGRAWARRYVQSNLIVLAVCALLFFLLLHNQLSFMRREICTAVALGCWQPICLLCLLGRRRFPWLWPAARTAAVVLFVGWQLFFLLARNPLDFWADSIRKWCVERPGGAGLDKGLDLVDDATRRYGAFNGIDQNWKMFTPPLARSAQFLAARIEFTGGGEEVVLSDNEPDPRGFFHFGGWRQRKLEDQLVFKRADELPRDEDLPLCEAYARWSVGRWRERHPADPRTPARVVLLRRDVSFPEPGSDPALGEPADVSVVGVFLADGSLVP